MSRIVKLTVLVFVASTIILWLRAGDSFHIARAFPLLGGYEPNGYDFAGLVLLAFGYWGYRRLQRPDDD